MFDECAPMSPALPGNCYHSPLRASYSRFRGSPRRPGRSPRRRGVLHAGRREHQIVTLPGNPASRSSAEPRAWRGPSMN